MTAREAQLFGPVREDAVTHFRLFAPSVANIMLEIAGRTPLAMARREDGFHEVVSDAAPGTRYRFVLQGHAVPDPASRRQWRGVHEWSVVPDPETYVWKQTSWRGRPWEESTIYELHVGLAGGFAGARAWLDELRDIGFTAIELMPIAAFPGTRNWGYDGVLPFAPAEAYGTPDELKAFIDRAHALDLMVYLDVVYNHFGPDGNYLSLYAPEFFRGDIATPWGTAIDFRRPQVRRFFIENALYWIHEFRFDGLRLDAVHAIASHDWLVELAANVHASLPRGRQVHLVLENDNNDASLLRHGFNAQWNDDFHHALHVLLTGERQGYYADHADRPAERLARVLRDGFDYQGEYSVYRSRPRGTPSADLAPTSFVSFLQNHDQVGNRAFGERLTSLADTGALRAAIALLLLAPQIPLVFMGEETGSETPFLFFTDHEPELAEAVRKGRAREFGFDHHEASLPDPNAVETFNASRPTSGVRQCGEWRKLYRDLLRVRKREIVVRLVSARAISAEAVSSNAVVARWRMADEAILTVATNLGSNVVQAHLPTSRPIWGESARGCMPPRSTIVWLDRR